MLAIGNICILVQTESIEGIAALLLQSSTDLYGRRPANPACFLSPRRPNPIEPKQVTENKTTMIDLKQTLLKVKSKTTVDVKYSRKEHSARVSSLLRVYEQYERQLEGQVRW